MSQLKFYDVVIIGGGPAGSSAAIYTARADHKTLVIDKGISSGALGITDKISNFPGIVGPVEGRRVLHSMRQQAQSFGAEFLNEKVVGLDLSGERKMIFTSQEMFEARAIILATGSYGRKANRPGEQELLGKGVSYCATCDGAFYRGKTVAVIGNSDEAADEALFLSRLVSKVYFISPSEKMNMDGLSFEKISSNSRIEILSDYTFESVMGISFVDSIQIKNNKNGESQVLNVEGVFIYLHGLHPVTDFLSGQLNIKPEGCVLVDDDLQTSAPGVFAAGDMICSRIKQAVIASADGVVAAMSVDKYLRGRDKTKVDWVHG